MCIIIHQEAMFVNINQSVVSVECNESAAVLQYCRVAVIKSVDGYEDRFT